MANYRIPVPLFLLLFVSIYIRPIIAVTCYRLDGREATSDIQACNLNATGQGGAHSACCKVENQDACLSTGLCLNTLATQASHILWATGCTDPTFLDPSCPKYCRITGWSNARLQNCNDTHYCCAEWDIDRDPEDCCKSPFPLDEPIGTVTRQILRSDRTVPGTPNNTTSSNNNTVETCHGSTIPTGAIIGLSVEGGALLVALAMLGYLLWSRRRMKQEMDELNRALAATAIGPARSTQAQAKPPYMHGIAELPINPQEMSSLREPSEISGRSIHRRV
ncbi:hypothetical protein F5B22DRAFT_622998 [Xylaria bambusicola]|uniref:uncharacterized protein n=1 Tax=Xylaria bambusicola TaxID=326684 RepID=UPI0020088DB3|nr:uncharacterized protein F5B22DRAFT_622998 [Xylaria bambusicola]KAI0506714.1 hypothetical protein F5B22DRAFT_622998 [Xylaria bambusicola]